DGRVVIAAGGVAIFLVRSAGVSPKSDITNDKDPAANAHSHFFLFNHFLLSLPLSEHPLQPLDPVLSLPAAVGAPLPRHTHPLCAASKPGTPTVRMKYVTASSRLPRAMSSFISLGPALGRVERYERLDALPSESMTSSSCRYERRAPHSMPEAMTASRSFFDS